MEQCEYCGNVYTQRGMSNHLNGCRAFKAAKEAQDRKTGRIEQVRTMMKHGKVDQYYILSAAGYSDKQISDKFGLMLLD
jgi:predicted  nucleic acid-binding Zn-ribbon protein